MVEYSTKPKNSYILTFVGTDPDTDGLPIHPAITPAFSVAGAYLIISGGIYLLVGIRTKW